MGTAAFFPETIAGEEAKILMVRMKPVTSQLNSLKKSWSSNMKGERCDNRKAGEEKKA